MRMLGFGDSVADVLLTDIRMPKISGIELIGQIREHYADIIPVVISGYQEFEYAKAVLKLHVVDYLLKPIIPSEMAEVMNKVKIQADKIYKARRAEILSGMREMTEMSEKYFPYGEYICMLARKNGLPRRFPKTGHSEFTEDMGEMIYMGRDTSETLYVIPEQLMDEENKKEIIRGILRREKRDAGYITLVIAETPSKVPVLPEIVQGLCRLMDSRLINGESQTCILENEPGHRQWNTRKIFSAFEKNLEYHQTEQAREELLRLGIYFENMKIAQSDLERMIDYVIILCKEYIRDFQWDSQSASAFEDIFLSSAGIYDIISELSSYIFKNSVGQETPKMDTEAFIQSLIGYMKMHMSENLSMKNIGHEFGISQTYLGKLFRKYTGQSFGACLLEIRLEKAKELLKSNHKILIKDVAEMVGYSDQFYFSRIFHSYTGVSPTEFIGTKS